MAAGWVPEPRADLGWLRAGHADRERAIDVLKAAFAEGRLDQDEYAERVGRAHAARTYGELAALTADLPVGPLGPLTPVSFPVPPPPFFPPGQLPQAPFEQAPFEQAQFQQAQLQQAQFHQAQLQQAQFQQAQLQQMQLPLPEIRPAHPPVEAGRADSGISGVAVVALICGVLSVVASWAFLMAVPAIIGGWIALAVTGRRGRWTAIGAIVLGVLAIWRTAHGG